MGRTRKVVIDEDNLPVFGRGWDGDRQAVEVADGDTAPPINQDYEQVGGYTIWGYGLISIGPPTDAQKAFLHDLTTADGIVNFPGDFIAIGFSLDPKFSYEFGSGIVDATIYPDYDPAWDSWFPGDPQPAGPSPYSAAQADPFSYIKFYSAEFDPLGELDDTASGLVITLPADIADSYSGYSIAGHVFSQTGASETTVTVYDSDFSTLHSPPAGGPMSGTDGAETIDGTAFHDVINAFGGADEVNGFGGADQIDGGAGNDRLFGGGEDDIIFGGAGQDQLFGENGNDVLDPGSGDDIVDGGAGIDTVVFDFSSVAGGASLDLSSVNLANDAVGILGSFDTKTLVGIERTKIVGGSGVDQFIGSSGDDEILGGGDSDDLTGGPGNDRLDGGSGDDTLSGGADNDTYVVDSVDDVVNENVGEGTDTVETSLGVGSTLAQRQAEEYQLPDNVENLSGTSNLGQGLGGNALNNVITAGSGADFVNASDGGSDHVSSNDGRDVIYYGAQLDSGDANNAGDEGGDARGDLLVIQGDYSAGLTLGADALIDVEKFRIQKGSFTGWGDTAGNHYSYEITTVDGNVAAGGRVVVQGGSLQLGEHLTFDGSAETDGSFQMFGGHDSDTLIGGAQGDHLLGRSGNDTLTGNGGDDRLRGGLGHDTMNGGSGSDTFVYAAQAGDEPYANPALESTSLGYDTIVGFNFAQDRIDLPQTVSSLAKVTSGSLSNASFDADLASAVDASLASGGAVLFTASGGGHSGETFLIVDADGNGSYQANADYVINLLSPVGTAPATPDFFV